jgi:hypothetical protein
MRANGEPNFSGVTISAAGEVNLTGTGVDPLSSTYKKAVSICQHLLPAGSSLPQEPSVPSISAPSLGLHSSERIVRKCND